MAKKKIEEKQKLAPKPPLEKMAFLIIGVYYLIVIGLIACLIAAEAEAFLRDPSLSKYSDGWRFLISCVFYGLPVIFGLIFGLTFRPFWTNFRNVTFIILIVHFLFSAIVYILRLNAEVDWRKEIRQSEIGQLTVKNSQPLLIDENKDGIIEKIQVKLQADRSRLNEGDYSLRVRLSQNDQPLPEGDVDVYRFRVAGEGSSLMELTFNIDALPLHTYLASGAVDMDLQLEKSLRISKDVKNILFFSRWAPFLKTTSWEGYDPEIFDRELEIQRIKRIASVQTAPAAARR